MNPVVAAASPETVKQVTSLVESAQGISEGRLALILAMMVMLALIVFIVELGRVAGWVREVYKARKGKSSETASPDSPSLNGSVATELIRSRVNDIHSNTTTCGATQRETLALLREHRQDMYKSLERIGSHIEAHTQAVQANTEVLRTMVEHFDMRPCQLDKDDLARRLGLIPSKS